jgi:hypothetical protein
MRPPCGPLDKEFDEDAQEVETSCLREASRSCLKVPRRRGKHLVQDRASQDASSDLIPVWRMVSRLGEKR